MLTEDLTEKIKALAFENPDVEELQFIRDANDDIDITDISGDGLVNNVVVVRPKGQPSPAVVFKHAPPYAKFLGPDTPVSQSRAATEFYSYIYFNKLCPGWTPLPYGYSPQNSILAMEYLDGYESLLDNLMTKSVNWRLLEQLIVTIATIHSSSHRDNIDESELVELQQKFPMTEIASKVGEYIFEVLTPDNPTYPINDDLREIAVTVYSDQEIQSNIRVMEDVYFKKRECLVHYDLHAGSVMIKGTSIKIIDNEFTVFGAAALDIGTLVNHFIYNYIREMTMISEDLHHDTTVADDMVKALRFTINLYMDKMCTSLCNEADSVFNPEVLISEIAGLMGCFVCERLLGNVPTKDSNVSDAAKLRGLQIGVRLVRQYPVISTVEHIMDCVRHPL